MDETFKKDLDLNIASSALKSLRLNHPHKVIIAHLNINSISEKFDQLSFIIRDNIDILVVGETKLDETFPIHQFHTEGYSQPYRKDRNRNGGGVMIFVKEDLPSKLLSKHTFHADIEALIVEINLRKTKFLLVGGYRPPSQSHNYFFDTISNSLDVYTGTYDEFLLARDFNVTETDVVLNECLHVNDFKCIVKNNTFLRTLRTQDALIFFLQISQIAFKIPVPYVQVYPIFIK